jgi:hypothetical protein
MVVVLIEKCLTSEIESDNVQKKAEEGGQTKGFESRGWVGTAVTTGLRVGVTVVMSDIRVTLIILVVF